MVEAGSELLIDNTLAARPVGAISTTFWRSDTSVCTIAATSDVLPVPALPRITIIGISSREARKRPKHARAFRWSVVGSKPNLSSMSDINSGIFTYFFSDLFFNYLFFS